MNLKDLLNDAMPIIEKSTPLVAQVLGQPTGIALLILSAIYESFGAPTNNGNFDFDQLSKNILNDPNADKKLKEVQNVSQGN